MNNSKFDEWAFDQTVKKGGTIFGCKDKDGVNVGFVNTGTGEYFNLSDEWISVVDESPDCEQGNRILAYNEGYVFECEFDDGFWSNLGGDSFTHWQPLPPPPQQPTGKG